ncbi:DegV family protein [Caryophanon latum]|uniref:Fatty acid-binding protein DegV n=1 Tax=Caryophanon latum TaxID=33977 RepID=A0A1C0Z389_9BACL|nr:DegV family protein [Caryophanon latum]OCS93760.1 fatty acid-binding protein DegV [Caryophanon latum]
MSKKVAWVTDTAALLTRDFIAQHNVHVLPLVMVFEDGSFKETVDFTHETFYDKLRNAKSHPKTSQPSFGEHVALYEKLKAEGYDYAIAVHVSGQQSGTVASSPMAAEQAGFKVYAIDSRIGSYTMQKMLEHAIDLHAQGVEPEEIVKSANALRDRASLSFIPASLSQLHKSGRVSGTAMFISNLLNIKLVISYDDAGVCFVEKKVRADKRARKEIIDLFEKDVKANGVDEAAVINCNDEKTANEWKAELAAQYPNTKFITIPLSAAVGVHAGEGTIGLTWVRNP